MATRTCGRCNTVKSVNDFNKKSSTRDGLRWECKSCSLELNKLWRNNNRARYYEQSKNYYSTNPQVKMCSNIHAILRHILYRGIYSVRTEEILGLPKLLA